MACGAPTPRCFHIAVPTSTGDACTVDRVDRHLNNYFHIGSARYVASLVDVRITAQDLLGTPY